MDSETLNPVIAAMAVYLALVLVVPKIIKKPTGIQFVDDVVLLLISQKGSLMSGTILVGLIVYLSKYVQDYMSSSSPAGVSSE
jgi:hypothetical protein